METRRHEVPDRRRRFPIGRVLAVAAALAIVVIWIWAFAAGRREPAGKLDDGSFGSAAEQICKSAADEIAALPAAYQAASPVERAEVLDRTNGVYRGMLDRLSAVQIQGERDAGMVHEWIADWRSYVDDRADYADRLRSDESARFYVSTKDGNQVTNPIERFARINGMLTCATPSDLS